MGGGGIRVGWVEEPGAAARSGPAHGASGTAHANGAAQAHRAAHANGAGHGNSPAHGHGAVTVKGAGKPPRPARTPEAHPAGKPGPREAQSGRLHPEGPAVPARGTLAGPPAARPRDAKAIKHFVLDTNVLLHDPGCLFVFQEHEVVIPFTVIEELDTFKRDERDRGRNAREVIRHLDRLRTMGRLVDGVPWGGACDPKDRRAGGSSPEATGVVRIDVGQHPRPPMLAEDKPDNRIVAVAFAMHARGAPVVFVSKDLNARIKADALGVRTEDFENQKVDADRLYTGFFSATVDRELIDDLYRDRVLPVSRVEAAVAGLPEGQSPARSLAARAGVGPVAVGRGGAAAAVEANQFVILRDAEDESHTGLARRIGDTDQMTPVTGPRKPVFGILARNLQQTMALDLLLDDDVRMVTLLGTAGTGKTLLAVAAGMAKVFSEQRYDKMLVARPIMPMGRDIGYLPGTKDDKLGAWMQPIFDNLSYLLSTRGATGQQQAESLSAEQRIEKLISGGQLVLEPLTYIRGRSIPHQFMIVDEAQNLTPHEVKTIVSRIGEGTKVVLTGDVGQIDNPYLDSASNGLAYAIEKMKGLRMVGHVTLARSERSELASLAAALL
ncbi:MAG: phosphate starvation-inducible protein PhoH [Planctomyces sp.]|nr:phosphate starvation-inducible protein PhoH [Planctomyces sp.]